MSTYKQAGIHLCTSKIQEILIYLNAGWACVLPEVEDRGLQFCHLRSYSRGKATQNLCTKPSINVVTLGLKRMSTRYAISKFDPILKKLNLLLFLPSADHVYLYHKQCHGRNGEKLLGFHIIDRGVASFNSLIDMPPSPRF